MWGSFIMSTIACGPIGRKNRRRWPAVAVLGPILAAGLLPGLTVPAFAQERPLWVKQLGTAGNDYAWGIATDGDDNVVVTGTNGGNLGDPLPFDAWVAKHDPKGRLLWKQRIGTSADDQARGVATDKRGNVFVAGWTFGSLGGPSKGDADAWLIKYDAGGRLKWKLQSGTSDYDVALAVATDSHGNALIAGFTHGSLGGRHRGGSDAWVAKYDTDGRLLWRRQPGRAGNDAAHAVTADNRGDVVIAGRTPSRSVFSPDAWVVKYDASGRPKWKRRLGTAEHDSAHGVAVDSNGNIVVAGYTDSALGGPSGGYGDAWVAKYDAGGHRLWTRQFGTGEWESASAVATDGRGNIFVSGTATSGGIGPEVAWLNKYDADGTPQWSRQLDSSTSEFEYSTGVATDDIGHVYIAGYTDGALGGPSRGQIDAFIAKYSGD
jgi:hypothetical protein